VLKRHLPYTTLLLLAPSRRLPGAFVVVGGGFVCRKCSIVTHVRFDPAAAK
jgi:hypothetical protein